MEYVYVWPNYPRIPGNCAGGHFAAFLADLSGIIDQRTPRNTAAASSPDEVDGATRTPARPWGLENLETMTGAADPIDISQKH